MNLQQMSQASSQLAIRSTPLWLPSDNPTVSLASSSLPLDSPLVSPQLSGSPSDTPRVKFSTGQFRSVKLAIRYLINKLDSVQLGIGERMVSFMWSSTPSYGPVRSI